MEDALVLARTSASVTIVHRRDAFRASNILAQRVIEHSKIRIIWNATVREIHGEVVSEIVESDDLDLDDFDVRKQVTGVTLVDTVTNQTKRLDCSAVFVAIGHSPATQFLNGLVDFDEERPGYIKTFGGSTKTSFPGIFAAGDVADSVYRQAITSAGSGAAAALDVERWLSELGLGNEVSKTSVLIVKPETALSSNRVSSHVF
jgi:thioredoxin reductase (NADPH)